jgi:riboflavin biosynthesis pyrimidine reductase
VDNAQICVDDTRKSGDVDGDETDVIHRSCHAGEVITADLRHEPDAIERIYGSARSLHDDCRPMIELCMVSSMDGSIAVDGRSGPLSGDQDRLVLATLRRSSGMVLVGAGTVRAEGYHEPRPDGPMFAVVTARGDLDWDSAFAQSPKLIVVTTDHTDIPSGIAAIRSRSSAIDLPHAVAELTAMVPAGGFIHAEGGAMLNGSLASHDLIDVVNLTVSGRLVGGDAPRITSGATPVNHDYDITHIIAGDEHLFTRWARRR